MKKSILFAVLLSIMGCQAPKDRSGDAVQRKGNPNATDPKVKTQVEPRVIVLDETPLLVNIPDGGTKNEMAKENLAEQTIEKTFTFTNETENSLSLIIEGSFWDKKDCVSRAASVLKAVIVSKNASQTIDLMSFETVSELALVEAADSIRMTVTMTNPGQCKSLKYMFKVSTQTAQKP